MGQHLLMGDLGGAADRARAHRPSAAAAAARTAGWAGCAHLAHPLVALPLWAADLYIWHVPGALPGGDRPQRVHALQHGCFIGFGVSDVDAAVRPAAAAEVVRNPGEDRLSDRRAVRPGPCSANVFMWSSSRLLSRLRAGEASWHIAAITDQSIAGVMMMVEEGLVTLGRARLALPPWAPAGHGAPAALDLADARGVPLSDARAARAAGRPVRERAWRSASRGHIEPARRGSSTCWFSSWAWRASGAEIAAARLMSPYFGASTIVWANTIAVVLVSLSVGYWLGGRLGDEHPHLRGLCLLVAGGGGPARRWSRSPRGPSCRSPWTRWTRSRPGPSSGRWSGCWPWWRSRSSCSAPARPGRSGSRPRTWTTRGGRPGRLYAVSTAGSLVGTMSAALC